MLRFATTALIGSICLAALSAAHAQDAVPRGHWLTQGADAKVRIEPCGAGLVCGSIAWLKNPIDPETGKRATDAKNPDPAKRSRPLIGVQLLLGLRPAGPGRWAGKIYNADDGQIYNGSITLLGPGRLKIEGCVFAICGSEIWTKTN